MQVLDTGPRYVNSRCHNGFRLPDQSSLHAAVNTPPGLLKFRPIPTRSSHSHAASRAVPVLTDARDARRIQAKVGCPLGAGCGFRISPARRSARGG
jgi:hypothetical protein